ncbi:Sec-independent protein translocase subunit TatA [Gulosibacter chungangensis]|uniref:Sec-independent protein translocase protein TatA n=1 Tax=Gulosibacter chungangensis TaxID=979746 RepID=A0A7J5BD62_9MICO|nr:Sec-independent protein translocase subunit TatA [Gulosibacter chungangensis]KAB1644158.1 twin-arginine translocase TatA/TatE family subunit [Gulosibacter chungangensis]
MPFGNLSGWTFVIILIIVLLLFGAPKLPKLAKSLGESMRIFKGEMSTMKKESNDRAAGDSEQDGSNVSGADRGATSTPPASTPPANTPLSDTPPSNTQADGNDNSTR